MPIEFGLASSHAPGINAETFEQWTTMYQRLRRSVPQPPSGARETEDVIDDYVRRIRASFAVLRDNLAAYRPDLLIIIGGDQTEMFDTSNVPNIMLFTGDVAWGHNAAAFLGQQPSEEDIVRYKVDASTAKWLTDRLVEGGYDVTVSEVQEPLGQPAKGMPHAFSRPGPWLVPALDIPVIMAYENTYDPPSLSASRCYELGRTLSRLFRNDPRRIAIYGSGGLSHDPGGPRSGWVDEPLDHWFLDRIAEGDGRASEALYAFDSMTMRGGTGEIRAWITVAGAMEAIGSKAEVVDYIPANHAVTGLGWAYWPTPSAVPA